MSRIILVTDSLRANAVWSATIHDVALATRNNISFLINHWALLNIDWTRLRYFIRDNCTSSCANNTSGYKLLFSSCATSETERQD
jgi:hypothetical protein